jgi:pyruvate dehydrogenase E2 component (dihydrolipoamide acetyltransferase)
VSSQVTLPRLGQGMESGTIVRWLKAEGDTVEKGQVLYELDTEKATQEVEAEASGTLLKILAGEGEEIEVGTAIAVIGDPGEDVPDAEPGGPAEEHREQAGAGAPRERAESEVASAPRPPAGEQRRNGGRVKASPLARRSARPRGNDLRSLRGTGPEGRIVADEV